MEHVEKLEAVAEGESDAEDPDKTEINNKKQYHNFKNVTTVETLEIE